jgi:hypothetical protein
MSLKFSDWEYILIFQEYRSNSKALCSSSTTDKARRMIIGGPASRPAPFKLFRDLGHGHGHGRAVGSRSPPSPSSPPAYPGSSPPQSSSPVSGHKVIIMQLPQL